MPDGRFALYPKAPTLPVESVAPREREADCRRCSRRTEATRHVLQGEYCRLGDARGTLLLVGGGPSRDDDAEGRPFVGRVGAKLRPLLRALWPGTVVLDHGTRCYPGRGVELDDSGADACRPYLAATLRDASPERVVCLGAEALYAVLGRRIQPLNSRRGYSWLWQAGKPVPVFFVSSPEDGQRNRFLGQYFDEDFRWALAARVPPPKHLLPDFFASMVLTPEDATAACTALRGGEGFAFDLEWAGFLWDKEFRLLTLGAAPVGGGLVWVWDEGALADPARWGPIGALLNDPEVGKGGSNVKADMHALWCAKKLRVRGVTFDTRLERKVLEPDATANLEDMAELVGMGGHKAEAERALGAIETRIRQWAAGQKVRSGTKQDGFEFATAVDSAARMGFDMEKYEGHPKAIAYAFLDTDLLHRYVARDALTTARLESLYSYRLMQQPSQQRIWDKVVLPAATSIQRVEEWGVPFDRQAGVLFRQMMGEACNEAYKKIQLYADPGKELNPGSPQQLGRVLYDRLGLKPPGVTESGAPSTDEEALSLLRATANHPLPGYILEYRHYQKLVGYADDWQRCVRDDGRIHPSIHLDGARSGRTSCIRRGTFIEIVRDNTMHPRGVPVEDVRVGDLAYCYDEEGKLHLRPVVKTWARGRRKLVRVHWRSRGGRTGYVDITPEHRLGKTDGTWCEASKLQPGDRLLALSRRVRAGYAYVQPTANPELREHRFIFEEIFGWSPEAVHHKNECRLDNRVSNLEGLTKAAHHSHHGGENTPKHLREFRSRKLKAQHASGIMPSPAGDKNPRWNPPSLSEAASLLREHIWSVTHAAKAGGRDFQCFKKHLTRLGFDVEELKRMNRVARRDQILAGAERARTARKANNHKVVRLEVLDEEDDVFDLMVEEHHNFIAGELLVKNCSDPNLQNIPRASGSADGKASRDCFAAPPGFTLVQLDYSQLELRIAALLSRDTAMADLFKSGMDFHLGTAKLICELAWGVTADKVTSVHRTGAKAFNFGIAYGKTDRSLAAELGISTDRAAQIRASIFGKFKRYGVWCREAVSYAKQYGGCWTMWEGEKARWRPLWRIADESEEGSYAASQARNGAINTPIQGTASDFCVASISRLVDLVDAGKLDAEVVLPIHDSVMLLCPMATWKESAATARKAMTDFPWCTDFVPLEVDIEVGQRWGSLEKVKL